MFADPRTARPMLKGTGEAQRVVVVEGITDYLALASRVGPETAVVGACSGGFGALAQARISPGAVVYAATDHDPAGDRYAGEICAAFRGTGRDVRRVDWKTALMNGKNGAGDERR
jgi:5S rRNA maturation endonuclease (ribonuclease M5)